jgi:hypothetical protein
LGIDDSNISTYWNVPPDSNERQLYVWQHDAVQHAVHNTLSAHAKMSLYSKIGIAFLKAIRPEILNDLMYEVLTLLNRSVDMEDPIQSHSIANLNMW